MGQRGHVFEENCRTPAPTILPCLSGHEVSRFSVTHAYCHCRMPTWPKAMGESDHTLEPKKAFSFHAISGAAFSSKKANSTAHAMWNPSSISSYTLALVYHFSSQFYFPHLLMIKWQSAVPATAHHVHQGYTPYCLRDLNNLLSKCIRAKLDVFFV